MRDIADRLNMPLTNDLGRYLGVPVLHNRVTVQTYQFILDHMDKRLSGWKANSLSLAGRVTLAQSVLAAIPSYVMQTAVLPVSICTEIDKRICSFVWGSSQEERKIHLLSWDQICLPKDKGGLGLRMARQLNLAYMTKLAFLFFQQPELFWVGVLQSKYFKETECGFSPRNTSCVSAIWKGITSSWSFMERGSRSAIRNGNDTYFWTSRWIDSGDKLIDLVDGSDPRIDLSISVASFLLPSGQWDLDRIRALLPDNLTATVVGMSPPDARQGEDQWSWGGETNGKFSISSAYNLITDAPSVQSSTVWKKVWAWRGPSLIRFFLWLAIQDRILTNSERKRRHISASDVCPYCNSAAETAQHVLRDCPLAA
ncbi:Putative ribonuclease H protein At1g65750 [Linum perenne]